MGDQNSKKTRKLHLAVSGRTTQFHIKMAKRSRRRPPITIEVE